jgi:hypothetical protein
MVNRTLLPLILARPPSNRLGLWLHGPPSNTTDNDLCPIYDVTAHFTLSHAITVAWKEIGGQRLTLGIHVAGKSYAALRAAWRMARLQFQELPDMFATLAMYEE